MQLALMLARSAHEIQKKSPGRFLVKQLLKLQPRRSGSVQIMQNVVCHVGESFEQNLVELMVRALCDVDTESCTFCTSHCFQPAGEP